MSFIPNLQTDLDYRLDILARRQCKKSSPYTYEDYKNHKWVIVAKSGSKIIQNKDTILNSIPINECRIMSNISIDTACIFESKYDTKIYFYVCNNHMQIKFERNMTFFMPEIGEADELINYISALDDHRFSKTKSAKVT